MKESIKFARGVELLAHYNLNLDIERMIGDQMESINKRFSFETRYDL